MIKNAGQNDRRFFVSIGAKIVVDGAFETPECPECGGQKGDEAHSEEDVGDRGEGVENEAACGCGEGA